MEIRSCDHSIGRKMRDEKKKNFGECHNTYSGRTIQEPSELANGLDFNQRKEKAS